MTLNLQIIGLAVAAIVVVIVIAVVLMFAGILPNPFLRLVLNDPEHSARYYPRDTLAYSWVTLYPEDGQRDQMMELWDRFNEFHAVTDQIEEWQEESEEEGIFDFEEDIMPWIGADASAGLFEMGQGNGLIGLFTVAVRNSGGARDFLDDWTEYRQEEMREDFEYARIDGIHIWLDEYGGAFILADDILLIVANDVTERAVEEVLELVRGEQDRNLAETENFRAAREALPDRRFASAYVNLDDLADLADDYYLDEWSEVAEVADSADLLEWAAFSAQFIDRGIAVDLILPNEDSYAAGLPNLDNPAERVSSETVGFLASTFDANLDNWRERLEDYGSNNEDMAYAIEDTYRNLYREVESQSSRPPRQVDDPTLADVLDLGLVLFEEYTDVDLEEDFLDLLGGTLVLAVEEFDWEDVEYSPEEETVNAVGMLSYRSGSEDALADTLEDLTDLVQDQIFIDIDIDSVDVGADRDAEIMFIDSDFIETDYEPGYVLHDGYLILGTTEEALENTVAARRGNNGDLASLPEYQRAESALPDDRQAMAWVNLHPFISQLDAEYLDVNRDEHEVLEDSIGSVAASFKADTQYLRATLVVTLFPE